MPTADPDNQTLLTIARLEVSRLKDIEFHARDHTRTLSRIREELEADLQMGAQAKRMDTLLERHGRLTSDLSAFAKDLEAACESIEQRTAPRASRCD